MVCRARGRVQGAGSPQHPAARGQAEPQRNKRRNRRWKENLPWVKMCSAPSLHLAVKASPEQQRGVRKRLWPSCLGVECAALCPRGCREGALTNQLAVLDVLEVFHSHFQDVCFFQFRLLIKKEFMSWEAMR